MKKFIVRFRMALLAGMVISSFGYMVFGVTFLLLENLDCAR